MVELVLLAVFVAACLAIPLVRSAVARRRHTRSRAPSPSPLLINPRAPARRTRKDIAS